MVPEGQCPIPNCSIVQDTQPGYKSGAYVVEQDDLGRIWIPKSNIHDDSELPFTPDHATMFVAEWFVEIKGWDKKL